MATRTISTKLAVEGESAYKSSLKNINSELGTLKSELKLVESEFSGQANSYAALSAKGEVLTKQYDAQKSKLSTLREALDNAKRAQETYAERVESAKSNIQRCEEALEALKNTEGDTSAEQARLTAELESYKKELSEAESYQEAATRSVNSWQTQVNTAQAELNRLDGEIDKNNGYLKEAEASSDGCAESIDEYGKEVKEAGEESEKAGKKFEAVKTTVTALGTAAAAAVTALAAATGKIASELVDMTVAGAAYADEVLTTSTVTGIATDKLQAYMYASDLLDVSVETLTGSMTKNLKSMDSARDGSAAYAKAYEQLGIAVTDAEGNLRDSEAVYWEVIDALGQVENTSERDALAMQLLGKSARDLNPLIEQGAERMNELAAEAEDAGYILSGDALDAYGAFQDNLDRLSRRAEGAKNALGTALLPTLTRLSGSGSDLLGKFTKAITECDGDLGKMGEVVGDTLEELIGVITDYTPEVVELAPGYYRRLRRSWARSLTSSRKSGTRLSPPFRS